MAGNQSPDDPTGIAASNDDPEVRLQNLEREVELIKTSIKRLLMDIRERMNELENPFAIATGMRETGEENRGRAGDRRAAPDARRTAPETRESVAEPNKARPMVMVTEVVEHPALAKAGVMPVPAGAPHAANLTEEQKLLSLLRSQVPGVSPKTAPHLSSLAIEKIRLQKIHKLFKWTKEAIRKFGHDRLEIILESYRTMGYISKESCNEIKEISRLMPANLGDEHEVGPDEFVSELYELNRILSPNDTSLDRDMIEVMMEKHKQAEPVPEGLEEPKLSITKRDAPRDTPKDEKWIDLTDRT